MPERQMMADFALDLDAFAGASIDQCSEHAQAIADMLGVVVRFNFNGVKCFAVPGGDATQLIMKQRLAARGPYDHKFANSLPPVLVGKDTPYA